MSSTIDSSQVADKISLKEIILLLKEWYGYLMSKWSIIIIIGAIGAFSGFAYAWMKKPLYVAKLTFVVEDEKSAASGLSGALGLANSLGLDIGGSTGGAFSGANLMELMKSRTLVQKALLQPIQVNQQQVSLADYLINFSGMNKNWGKDSNLNKLRFDPLANPESFTVLQDSIMNILWEKTIRPDGILMVYQKDKKVSIITVESKSTDEKFSKVFTETIAKVVSTFYVETKTKRAKQNLEVLQKQVDSVKAEINNNITRVALANDEIFMLNPAYNIKRTPSTQKQVDLQTNTAALAQLIPSLEIAKLSLRKETPLIQVIDKPVFPLRKEKLSKLKTFILVGIISVFLTIVVLILKRIYKKIMSSDLALKEI